MKHEHIVYGIHAVQFVLKKRPETVLALFMSEQRQDSRLQTLRQSAQKTGIRIQAVSPDKLKDLALEGQHQGVVARCKTMPEWTEADLIQAIEAPEIKIGPLLILDGVQDPHNLGAILRTADAAGVLAVVIPKDRATTVTPVVRKVASGAAESVPVVTVTNLARCMEKLKAVGVWIKGASAEAPASLYQIDFTGCVAIVLGAEGSGLRSLTEAHCDELFSIPMLGMVESLNVSVAAGICLYEAFRQRKSESKMT